jgi:hypothetical protein
VAYTSTDLTNIERAIASGVLEVVTSDGKKVRYQSLADLMRVRDYVAAQLAPTNRKASVSYVRHRRES